MKTLSFQILGETLVIDEQRAVRLIFENRRLERTEVVMALSCLFIEHDILAKIAIFSNMYALKGRVLDNNNYTGDKFGFMYSYVTTIIPEELSAYGQRVISATLEPITLYNISK